MKAKIIAWMQSPRNFYEGAAIYNTYGHNLILKRRFANKNETTEALLLTELCKLADISEAQARKLPRHAKNNVVNTVFSPTIEYQDDTLFTLMGKLGITTTDLEAETIPESLTEADQLTQDAYAGAKQAFIAIPETTKRVIKIREEFPFLKDDNCPVEIKVLVHDMFNAYDKYRDAHLKLTEAPENTDIEQLFTLAQETIENHLSNRAMWAELEHYKEKNEILGEHPILQKYALEKEIRELPDLELKKRQGNARPNVSKYKKDLKNANGDQTKIDSANEGLAKWSMQLDIINAELELRKKS